MVRRGRDEWDYEFAGRVRKGAVNEVSGLALNWIAQRQRKRPLLAAHRRNACGDAVAIPSRNP